ncbi:hypothetical protein JK635_08050 [Neobacillus sp. YIM B02564]|uniref:Uncharacterized protein n=1 Tax=Neobacillus paridis TaxID=2803862 RepID=A0ABS1TLI3_9BACI|nr:hypothetical protein [Neobacillus paridis]MBL4952163.1 hypothetical protein [Neobacillus paridis]
MALFEKAIDMVLDAMDWIEDKRKNRTMVVKLSRSDHHKLQLIADDLNEYVQSNFDITPEFVATRVLEVFVEQAYGDSVKKVTRRIMSDFLD